MNPKAITSKIKKLRLGKRMTLERLAKETGLTKGYLSRIENSEKAPPLFTLDNVARALGVDITFLLSEDTANIADSDIVLVKKGEGKTVLRRPAPYGYEYQSLAYKKAGKNMEPYLLSVRLKKQTRGGGHPGEEFIYVLDGKMKFFYGDRTFLVEKGDSLYFDSSLSHSAVSLGAKEAKLLCVIFSYKRS